MTPEYLVIHTAGVENASFDAVKRYHIEERGWDDIGYHFYITKDGRIHKGRDENTVGAHCKASSMNHKSLGICFEGNHDKEGWTVRQKQSFRKLCQVLKDKYDIPKENVIGHREAYTMHGRESPKTCPGNNISMDHVRMTYAYSPAKKVDPAELEYFMAKKSNWNPDIN